MRADELNSVVGKSAGSSWLAGGTRRAMGIRLPVARQCPMWSVVVEFAAPSSSSVRQSGDAAPVRSSTSTTETASDQVPAVVARDRAASARRCCLSMSVIEHHRRRSEVGVQRRRLQRVGYSYPTPREDGDVDAVVDTSWFSATDLATLRELGSHRSLRAGSTLFMEGDGPHDVTIVESDPPGLKDDALHSPKPRK